MTLNFAGKRKENKKRERKWPNLTKHSLGSSEDGSQYFEIDPKTGIVSQTRTVPALEVGVQFEEFQLTVRATENSAGKRSATARLVVRVEAEDTTPPVLRVSPSDLGYVNEHASVGTVVTDANGVPLKFSVSDQDKEVSLLPPA